MTVTLTLLENERSNKPMCLPLKPFKIEREWEHAGLKCAVVQNREAMNRCGYVRVPPTHPLHGKDYDDADVNVHGGLTFAEGEPCEHEDGKGWWFGFDCAHAGDAMYDPNPDWTNLSAEATSLVLSMRRIHREVLAEMQGHYPGYRGEAEHYWLQAEVERETESLAQQLAALNPGDLYT